MAGPSPSAGQARRSRRPTPARLVVSLFVLWLAAAPACATAGTSGAQPPATIAGATGDTVTYPLTIVDGSGRQVRIEHEPQRIISYWPSNTETLYALGAGDRIVGTDNYSDYPADVKSKPKLGGTQVNLETLVALQPDLVISVGLKQDLPALLEPQHIPAVVLDYQDIAGTLKNIELIGRVVGKPAEAAKLVAAMRSRMEAVSAKVRTAPKVRVYYEVDATDPTKPVTAGPGSFIDSLVTLAGGANVAAGATGQYPRLSAEEIVRADPEVIVVPVGSFSPPDAANPARFAQRPGWETIAAVQRGAIRGVDADLISRPGPRLVDGLDQLAGAVHPELFGSAR